MVDLQEQIIRLNKWHYDPNFRLETSRQYRDLFNLLSKNFIDKNISLSISGLRRVGKTTIMLQLINYLLDHKTVNKNILYWQFSDESTNLNKVLELFFTQFTDQEINRHEFYIFLDELQYAAHWQNLLKYYIDRNNKIKFIVSGSASIYLRGRTRESLAGRILDFQLGPLSFSEMIRLKENYQEPYSAPQILKNGGGQFKLFQKLGFARLPFRKLLNSYLKFGEFPALLPYLNNDAYCHKYLTDGIIDKILQKDIRLFEVEKQEEISLLYKICCSNTGQMINLRNIAAETGLSYPTIKKYLSVLKKTFLIDSIKNRLRSIKSQAKSLDKVFSASINLTAAMLSIADPLTPPYLDFKGHIVESFIYNSLKKLGNIYYYNKAGKEVDLIIESDNQIIPVEVKSSPKLKKTDLNHLVDFMKKNNLGRGYLVYGGELNRAAIDNKKIYFLPYWLF